MPQDQNNDWHLHKWTIMSLILALVVNAGGSLWWASRLDTTVNVHEIRIGQNAAAIAANSQQNILVGNSLARLQEGQKFQTEMIKDLKADIKVALDAR